MADEDGKLYRVKMKDPSFVNWPALESFAVLKNIVPDFPLCNKSFNSPIRGTICNSAGDQPQGQRARNALQGDALAQAAEPHGQVQREDA